jgi:hypothetical protein
MKNVQPPRLAVALLNRFLPDNEPLVGDLLEEFAAGKCHVWLWRQVILALLMGSFRRRVDVRPLRLVDHSPVAIVRPDIRPWSRTRTVNLTGSPLPGVGGLSLIIFGTLMTIVSPQVWWVVLLTILSGVVLGFALVLLRRRTGLGTADSGHSSPLHLVAP